jgi:2-C-methyl-D-erythritol 4-phosphate cytidylyltransferase
VLIHDIRRPLAPAALRDRVIAELREGSTVVMPALPLTDSVKAVDARGSVTGTLDRSTLQAVQYPRGFASDRLAQLLTGRKSEEFDELEEAIRAGVPITMVDGDPDAFVVDLPADAAFVEAVIACRDS